MRKFDHNGLLLAEYQGKLFEKSYDLKCSTGIFIRRFIHSNLLNTLDSNNPALLSLDVNEGISSIIEQFGETRFVMDLFAYKQMNDVYYTFHTQDPEWCIASLLDICGLDENIFDNNFRLKEAIKEKGTY